MYLKDVHQIKSNRKRSIWNFSFSLLPSPPPSLSLRITVSFIFLIHCIARMKMMHMLWKRTMILSFQFSCRVRARGKRIALKQILGEIYACINNTYNDTENCNVLCIINGLVIEDVVFSISIGEEHREKESRLLAQRASSLRSLLPSRPIQHAHSYDRISRRPTDFFAQNGTHSATRRRTPWASVIFNSRYSLRERCDARADVEVHPCSIRHVDSSSTPIKRNRPCGSCRATGGPEGSNTAAHCPRQQQQREGVICRKYILRFTRRGKNSESPDMFAMLWSVKRFARRAIFTY